MKLYPLESRVVVKPITETEQKKGSIIVPDVALDKPQIGKIVAIGPSTSSYIGLGSTVLYGRYSGTEIEIDGEELLILREFDILARVDED